MYGQILSGEQQYAGTILKTVAEAADSEGQGKGAETKKYLASVKLTGRTTKCNLGWEGGGGGERNTTSKFQCEDQGFSLFCLKM
jgi:hypothetical protein